LEILVLQTVSARFLLKTGLGGGTSNDRSAVNYTEKAGFKTRVGFEIGSRKVTAVLSFA
jgi:hypothetical protein